MRTLNLITLLLLLCAAALLPGNSNAFQHAQQIDPAVRQALAEEGEVRAIVQLQLPPAPPTLTEAQQIAAAQEQLLARLPEGGFELVRRYQSLPALAGVVRREALAQLEKDPLVALVQADLAGSGHLGQSVAAVEADRVWQELGLSGKGVRVAVLDTGVDLSHPDLAGAVVAQQCFTDGDCVPGDSNQGAIAQDEHGHGTNVTGVLTSRGVVGHPGFAPQAEIVALRVLDDQNWGWLSDWVAALDWIISNHSTLQVDVVNISLGTFALYDGNCDTTWPTMAQAMSRLNTLGVVVFSSSGNQGNVSQMGSPACNSNVVAVGATYDGNLGRQPFSGTYRRFGSSWPDCYDAASSQNLITCFTNSGPMLDLVAPGAMITASGLGGGLSTYVGTSQASPAAAGVAALMLEANDRLTPAQIEAVLRGSGPLLPDVRNGRSIPSLNARVAVSAVMPTAPHSVTLDAPPIALPGVAYQLTSHVLPVTTTLPLTYTWQATGHSQVVRTTNSTADSMVYSWPALGPQVVTVTVRNELGMQPVTTTVDVISGVTLNLPVLEDGD